MKIKFNKFERVAGTFVLVAVGGAFAMMIGVAYKRGWFDSKVQLETTFVSADGLHAGTMVQMAGLRAGSVTAVELKSNNEIRVIFEISEKFHERVREDSVVSVMRPFIIGEKVLDITVGTDNLPRLQAHSQLKSAESTDLMDLLNGKKMGAYFATLSKMVDNLRYVAEALLDPERSRAFVEMFDELSPLVKNMNSMSREASKVLRQVNGKDQLAHTVNNLALLTGELAKALPVMSESAPKMAQDFTKIAHNMAILTDEMQKALPMLQQMAPEFPRASRRALEALDETVVVLKAMQKSFLLRGSAREVREEEAKRGEYGRWPASEGAAASPDAEPK